MSPRRKLPVRKSTPHRKLETNAWKLVQTVNRDYVVIGLHIPPHAKTNRNRPNVINHNYAKFRTNYAIVTDTRGIRKTVYSLFGPETIRYKFGKEVKPLSKFDDDIKAICSTGIHFFNSREAAKGYNRSCHIILNIDGDRVVYDADYGTFFKVTNRYHELFKLDGMWISGTPILVGDEKVYRFETIPESIIELFPSYPRWKDDVPKLG